MFHPTLNINRVRIAVVAGVALVVIASASFIFTHTFAQVSLPSAQKAPAIAQPAAASPKMDLGAGYTLENGQIVAPSTYIRPAVASPKLDLGAGYTLENGQISAPVTVFKASPAAASPKLDLGAGYVLENGKITAPMTVVKNPASLVRKMDIGGGYWLVTGPDGGQIMK